VTPVQNRLVSRRPQRFDGRHEQRAEHYCCSIVTERHELRTLTIDGRKVRMRDLEPSTIVHLNGERLKRNRPQMLTDRVTQHMK
jgi:hypothetical protein